MIYLGVHNSWQSGAALIVNGKVVGAVSEESLTELKFSRDANSID